jgi:hypothetical protein
LFSLDVARIARRHDVPRRIVPDPRFAFGLTTDPTGWPSGDQHAVAIINTLHGGRGNHHVTIGVSDELGGIPSRFQKNILVEMLFLK